MIIAQENTDAAAYHALAVRSAEQSGRLADVARHVPSTSNAGPDDLGTLR